MNISALEEILTIRLRAMTEIVRDGIAHKDDRATSN